MDKSGRSKGWRTNIVAYATGIIGVIIFGLYMADVIDTDKFTLAIATLATLGTMVGNKLAKDQKESHTKD